MKVLEIKKFIKNLQNNQEIYVGYSDEDELNCELYTEQDIIDKANDNLITDEETYNDINDALSFLADAEDNYHFMS